MSWGKFQSTGDQVEALVSRKQENSLWASLDGITKVLLVLYVALLTVLFAGISMYMLYLLSISRVFGVSALQVTSLVAVPLVVIGLWRIIRNNKRVLHPKVIGLVSVVCLFNTYILYVNNWVPMWAYLVLCAICIACMLVAAYFNKRA